MKIKFSLFIFLPLLLHSKFSNAEIKYVEQKLILNNPAKLSYLLRPYIKELPHNSYLPGFAIYDDKDQSLQKTREELLVLLELYAQSQSGDDARSIRDLIRVIHGWELRKRINVFADFDAVRINGFLNPQLPAGEYTLRFPLQLETAFLVTLLNEKEVNVKLPGKEISDVILKSPPKDFLEESYVWIINLDGSIDKLGIAYWNQRRAQLMPGMIIYSPLKESIFSTLPQQINRLMLELLANRIIK